MTNIEGAEIARRENNFRAELATVINRYSKESGSDTPDFILAEYLENCLAAFDAALTARTLWYGGKTTLPEPYAQPDPNEPLVPPP